MLYNNNNTYMCTKDVVGKHCTANGLTTNVPDFQGNMSGACSKSQITYYL